MIFSSSFSFCLLSSFSLSLIGRKREKREKRRETSLYVILVDVFAGCFKYTHSRKWGVVYAEKVGYMYCLCSTWKRSLLSMVCSSSVRFCSIRVWIWSNRCRFSSSRFPFSWLNNWRTQIQIQYIRDMLRHLAQQQIWYIQNTAVLH